MIRICINSSLRRGPNFVDISFEKIAIKCQITIKENENKNASVLYCFIYIAKCIPYLCINYASNTNLSRDRRKYLTNASKLK